MNGINYESLFGNTGLFSNKDNIIKNKAKFPGSVSGAKRKTTDKKMLNQDTVEINGKSRQIQKAGYDKPKKRVDINDEEAYKKLDANGVQEGIELSDAAKQVLEELRQKYQNMDIKVVNWSSDKEQEYYAGKTDKEFSVLFAPEALEAMAADPSERAKYESILDSAGQAKQQMKDELGDAYEGIESFTITVDKDGNVSYTAQLIKDFAERNTQNNKDAAERLEEQQKTRKEEAKKLQEKQELERIEAKSLEELLTKIKEKHVPVTEDKTEE